MDDAGEARRPKGHILWGAILMVAGLGITAAAFLLIPGGGYVIGWGVVFLGALFFLLGLTNLLLTRKVGAMQPRETLDVKTVAVPGVTAPTEIDEHEVRSAEAELRRLGVQHNGRNFVYWIVANRKLDEARKTADWTAMGPLYSQLARRLYEDGKSHLEVARAAQTCELRAYLPFGVDEVEVSTVGESSCRQCKSLHGRRLKITVAMDEMPLPIKNCSNQVRRQGDYGWCRCSYTAVLDR